MVELDGYRPGCLGGIVASDDSHPGAQLRWFISAVKGNGPGGTIIERAMRFCDKQDHDTVWLTSYSWLEAARRLYERQGFRLVGASEYDQWQGGVREKQFDRLRFFPPVPS